MSNYSNMELSKIDGALADACVPNTHSTSERVRILARRLEFVYRPGFEMLKLSDTEWSVLGGIGPGLDELGTGPTPWEALDDAISKADGS